VGRNLFGWGARILLLLPAVLLLAAAIPRFVSGRAVDAAFPVPAYMVLNQPLPLNSYRAAADVLAKAGENDGRAILERAEAASLGGDSSAHVMALLRSGLAETPASVRGWTLLAEQLVNEDPQSAKTALEHSVLLGRYEYFVAGKRSRVAATMWDQLPPDVQAAILPQTRLLWTDITLRTNIAPLLTTPGGRELVGRAFRDDPEQLRALNRYLADERRRAAANR